MTDIVKRLRDPLNNWNSGGRFEAADEIERLQAALGLFVNFCTYPVDREINPRGYAWRPEKDLDYARGEAQKVLGLAAEQALRE